MIYPIPNLPVQIVPCELLLCTRQHTLLRSGGNLHHATFRNPTAAVNLFLVGKQYLTLLQAEAAVTRNLIGRKIISIVKRSDTRNALPTVAFVKVD